MPNKKQKLVLCHLFYEDLAFNVAKKLQSLNGTNTFFLFNLAAPLQSNTGLIDFISNNFSHKAIIKAPNVGRDIGAKLRLFQLAEGLGIDHEYTLITHDKKSPHIKGGENWGADLLKIADSKNLDKVFSVFEREEKVGIIGSANYIQNEFSEDTNTFLCTSNQIIKSILKQYQIKPGNYDFVAGNIFWIRSSILKQFFKFNISTDKIIASLEKGGNVVDFSKGTRIHAWERIMCWIATSQGYSIYGI